MGLGPAVMLKYTEKVNFKSARPIIMPEKRHFKFEKVQIENFLKKEFEKSFKGAGRISIRKRQKFMNRINKKVGKQFGKDVLCLVDFTRQGFVTLVSPSHQESTDKGKLYHSFIHPQVAYTSHCIDRFSERTGAGDNCIILLDEFFEEAMLTFGLHDGYLVCRSGVFAYVVEQDRLVIKTFINSEMLSDDQIREFYGWDVVANFSPDCITQEMDDADFRVQEEPPPQSLPSGDR